MKSTHAKRAQPDDDPWGNFENIVIGVAQVAVKILPFVLADVSEEQPSFDVGPLRFGTSGTNFIPFVENTTDMELGIVFATPIKDEDGNVRSDFIVVAPSGSPSGSSYVFADREFQDFADGHMTIAPSVPQQQSSVGGFETKVISIGIASVLFATSQMICPGFKAGVYRSADGNGYYVQVNSQESKVQTVGAVVTDPAGNSVRVAVSAAKDALLSDDEMMMPFRGILPEPNFELFIELTVLEETFLRVIEKSKEARARRRRS
jgi:hypothetical protein